MSVLAWELLGHAQRADAMIAVAESCTAGGLAAAITEVPGSSEIFDRGFVTYSNAAKRELLGVTAQSLDAYGAVSESVAWEMAEGALHNSHAQIAVSVTGIAGPGGSEAKPEGRVCFGLAREGAATRVETVDFGALGRSAVRAAAVDHALRLLIGGLIEMVPAADTETQTEPEQEQQPGPEPERQPDPEPSPPATEGTPAAGEGAPA